MIKLFNKNIILIIGYLILSSYLLYKTGLAQGEEGRFIFESISSNPDMAYLQEIVNKAPDILNNLTIQDNRFIVETDNIKQLPNILEVLIILFGAPSEVTINIIQVGCHLTYILTASY